MTRTTMARLPRYLILGQRQHIIQGMWWSECLPGPWIPATHAGMTAGC
jgi:hypothetical protein